MPGPVFLESDRLSLRTVESEDREFIRSHWNSPELRHWFAKTDPIDSERLSDFLETNDTEVHFLPCRDSVPVGFLWLFRIDDVAGRGEIGYWVSPEEQGNGYATEAAELGLRYAFNERGLHKVMARVFEGNKTSQRILEKLGFEEEGYLREHYFVDGEYVDTRFFGLLADDK
ncbi:GNAT family N-acetyltransferase [Halopelagius longus]|nr:GNAT family protein [Halopelagius longus]SDQ72033.1 Protein N-acetyltransferase, RimJ/RimL family [Halopelagius longus]